MLLINSYHFIILFINLEIRCLQPNLMFHYNQTVTRFHHEVNIQIYLLVALPYQGTKLVAVFSNFNYNTKSKLIKCQFHIETKPTNLTTT